MKLTIGIFLSIILFPCCTPSSAGPCKTIEESCSLTPLINIKCKTVEESCRIKSLDDTKGVKTIKESCKINHSLLADYIAKIKVMEEQKNK